MMKIKGRYSEDNQSAVPGEWTVDEIRGFLQQGFYGMLSSYELPWHYVIDQKRYTASGLVLGDGTLIYEENGKIKIPTWFKRNRLNTRQDGAPEEPVFVDVWVEPSENLFVTIVKDSSKT